MMSCNCGGGCGCHKGKCGVAKFAFVLVIIGAINWGLVGVGMLMNNDLNLVNMLLGSWPTVEAIVYLLVGISALVKIFGCPCKQCKEACKDCQVSGAGDAPKV